MLVHCYSIGNLVLYTNTLNVKEDNKHGLKFALLSFLHSATQVFLRTHAHIHEHTQASNKKANVMCVQSV